MSCLVLWSWLAAVNVVAFAVALGDKAQAVRGGRRVPELVLLAKAWLGGWVGLVLAFVVARHKVRKASFLAPFLVGVLLSTVALLLLVRRLGCLAGLLD